MRHQLTVDVQGCSALIGQLTCGEMELDLRLYLGTHCCSLSFTMMLEGLAPALAGR